MAAYLSEADHKRVSDAVAAAEARTAGEIVTVVADRSDGYSDVAFAWAVLASFTALAVFALFPQFVLGKVEWLAGGWQFEWTDRELLGIALALAILKFLGG
jgi:putative membrane protein